MIVPTKQNTKTVAQLGRDPKGVVAQAQASGAVYVFEGSEPQVVILGVEEFAMLLQHMDELHEELDMVYDEYDCEECMAERALADEEIETSASRPTNARSAAKKQRS